MKEQTNELKPCPFCGGTKVIVYTNVNLRGDCAGHCYQCGTYGPFCEDEEDAITAWNRRVCDE